MDKRNLAFDRTNFIMIAVSMLVVVVGFVLMSGGGSNEHVYDPEIFSTMRIKVAPIVCFVGFVSMICGIMRKPKSVEAEKNNVVETEETDSNNLNIQ